MKKKHFAPPKGLPNEKTQQMAEDLCLLETYLQWLQVHRQQCLNLKFARPHAFSEGELAAFNRAIAHLEQVILQRNEDLVYGFHPKKERR